MLSMRLVMLSLSKHLRTRLRQAQADGRAKLTDEQMKLQLK